MTFIALCGALTKQNRERLELIFGQLVWDVIGESLRLSCWDGQTFFAAWSFDPKEPLEGFCLFRWSVKEKRCLVYRTSTLLPRGRLFIKPLDFNHLLYEAWLMAVMVWNAFYGWSWSFAWLYARKLAIEDEQTFTFLQILCQITFEVLTFWTVRCCVLFRFFF